MSRTPVSADGAGLAGALHAHPGQPRPFNLRSSRPAGVERLAVGRLASQLPVTLGSLFSLCGHAHRLCAGLAVATALAPAGTPAVVPAALRQRLAARTLREHVQRLWLEAPRLRPDARHPDAPRRFALGPLVAAEPELAASGRWLQAHLFGMSPAGWIERWQTAPADWLDEWAGQSDGEIAATLRAVRPDALRQQPGAPALRVHADPAALGTLAVALRDQPGFARAPLWQGDCAETGPWTRLHDDAGTPADTVWLRLGARLADIARLVQPDAPGRAGTLWLDTGAQPLGPGEAIAWVEMSRGLLLHRVAIEGEGDGARVADCQVLAPTDWNFHPDGAVARALETLSATDHDRLELLIHAYDPCVPLRNEGHAPLEPKETDHA